MAEGWAAAAANSALDTLLAAHPWVQLHTAAPGAAGTANVATETDRIQATWTAAAAGAAANDGALTWAAVSGAEDYTHFTAWSASSAGSFGFSGAVTANAVMVGDNFVLPDGDLDVSLVVAS